MKIVQLATGNNRVRQLSAAFAEVHLRKRGLAPPITYPANGNYRAWTDEEFDTACFMRLSGKSHDEIAKALGRSRDSINRAIGHECGERGRYARTDRRD